VSQPAEPPAPGTAYLGLGTNMGDRAANLRAAVAALAGLGAVIRVSDIYESDPIGYADQPRYWNMAVQLSTRLKPAELLGAVKEIEVGLGRVPTFRMGPRLIDIDLLLYDAVVLNTPLLQVPHHGMLQRPFVLWPLVDLDPGLVHPVTGESVATTARTLGMDHTIRRLGPADEVLT
jgi:2-amino-4-hydroxy-6-hydroxymethyldihydropteridine diphosphokinase